MWMGVHQSDVGPRDRGMKPQTSRTVCVMGAGMLLTVVTGVEDV